MTTTVRLAALLLVLGAAACRAPSEAPGSATLTVDAAMTRGPVTAPVTIVEFSDYQ